MDVRWRSGRMDEWWWQLVTKMGDIKVASAELVVPSCETLATQSTIDFAVAKKESHRIRRSGSPYKSTYSLWFGTSLFLYFLFILFRSRGKNSKDFESEPSTTSKRVPWFFFYSSFDDIVFILFPLLITWKRARWLKIIGFPSIQSWKQVAWCLQCCY